LPHDRLVLVEDLVGDPVTVPGPELGRALHVGEQQRDRAAAPLVHGSPGWYCLVRRVPRYQGPWSSRWSRLMAALISDRWVKAWGKLPSCSPVRPISSAYRPRWLA